MKRIVPKSSESFRSTSHANSKNKPRLPEIGRFMAITELTKSGRTENERQAFGLYRSGKGEFIVFTCHPTSYQTFTVTQAGVK